jgi:hypothetical protein
VTRLPVLRVLLSVFAPPRPVGDLKRGIKLTQRRGDAEEDAEDGVQELAHNAQWRRPIAVGWTGDIVGLSRLLESQQ